MYRDVKRAPWHLKSPVARLFAQQHVNKQVISKVHITGPLWGLLTTCGFHSHRDSAVDSFFMSWRLYAIFWSLYRRCTRHISAAFAGPILIVPFVFKNIENNFVGERQFYTMVDGISGQSLISFFVYTFTPHCWHFVRGSHSDRWILLTKV